MLAATRTDGTSPADTIRAALGATGVADVQLSELDGVALAVWGLEPTSPTPDQPLLLSRTNWRRDGSVTPELLARWIRDESFEFLAEMLPPFAAVGRVNGGVRVIADRMGFRQIYLSSDASLSAVSTSALALSAIVDRGLDEDALALQSQLGWQLDQATLFRGVTKLSPGESVRVVDGRLTTDFTPAPEPVRLRLEEAVDLAATVLREFMASYLDENPDPLLQLTGGQDSRLLLSAIPCSRRRGLKVMTVDVAGSRDAEVAGALAQRYGMHHVVRSLDGLSDVSPDACFQLVCQAAERLDCMADPLARAATLWAERSIEQGPRLSGLGGEIARGFYYTGRVRRIPITGARVDQLARWRMLANEPAESVALVERLSVNAPAVARRCVERAIRHGGVSWYEAVDELYYRHRMQRWAGLGETAVCFDRALANPMLDDRFVTIARGLSPLDKRGSRFLGQLQVVLDEELASLPLDSRPPPRTYAEGGPINAAKIGVARLQSAERKVRQRLLRARRPPAGASTVARLFSEHIRQQPEILNPVYAADVFSPEWLDSISSGSVTAAPSTLALLANVLVATSPTTSGGERCA